MRARATTTLGAEAKPAQIDAEVNRLRNSNEIYLKLFSFATRKTALADVRYDDSGNKIEPNETDELDGDSSVVIVQNS